MVQKVGAALAVESVNFVETNPEPPRTAIGKIPRIKDPGKLRSAYEACAKTLINRAVIVPAKMVGETLAIPRVIRLSRI